jgi:hypothetical protein
MFYKTLRRESMKNKLKIMCAILGFSVAFVIPSANAVPFTFFDPDHGTCDIFGETDFDYLYRCEDGAILYIGKQQLR